MRQRFCRPAPTHLLSVIVPSADDGSPESARATRRWSAPGAAAQAGDSKRKEIEHRLTRVIGAKAQEQHTDVFSFAADYCANL